jgi:hypothetical protein
MGGSNSTPAPPPASPQGKGKKTNTPASTPVSPPPSPVPAPVAAPVAAAPKLTEEQQEIKDGQAAWKIQDEKEERARLLASQINTAAAAGHIIPTSVIYAQEQEIQNIGKVVPPGTATMGASADGGVTINANARPPPPDAAPPGTTPPPTNPDGTLAQIVVPPKTHYMRNFFFLALIVAVVAIFLMRSPSDPADVAGNAASDKDKGGEGEDSDKGKTVSQTEGKASLRLLLVALGFFVLAAGLAVHRYLHHRRNGTAVAEKEEGPDSHSERGAGGTSYRGSG